MKIYIISAQYHSQIKTALSTHVVNLTIELAKLGYEVIVLTMGIGDSKSEETIYFNFDSNKKIKIKVYRFFTKDSDKVSSPFEGTKLQEINRLEEFGKKAVNFLFKQNIKNKTIIHLHGHSIIPSFAKELRKNPNFLIVTSIHTFDSISEAKKADSGAGPYIIEYLKQKEEEAIKYSHCTIVRSKSVYDQISLLFPDVVKNANIKIVPSGVSTFFINHPKLSPEELDFLKKKYNIKEKFILSINKIEPSKGIEYGIEALGKIIKRYKQSRISMLIIGSTEPQYEWYFERLEKYIKKEKLQNNIKFSFEVSERERVGLFNLSDVFLLTSVVEPFGISIVEALSKNVPVVASGVEGPKDIFGTKRVKPPYVLCNGGLLVYYDDPFKRSDYLSLALWDILSNPEKIKRTLPKGREKALNLYSWESIVKKKIEIYNSLLK